MAGLRKAMMTARIRVPARYLRTVGAIGEEIGSALVEGWMDEVGGDLC